jgi:16S rRNA (uracil1498-N3)-methyltransferase
MRRYWVPQNFILEDKVELSGEVLHHIRDVCRMRIGNRFEVLSENQKAYLVEMISESKHQSLAQIIEVRDILPIPRPHIVLALSIPRFNVYEAILEKSVELGVHSIQPFFSDYSFIRKQEDVLDKKAARFQKIIQSATQQSGRGDFMPILQPLTLPELLKNFNREQADQSLTGGITGLFAYEGDSETSLKKQLIKISQESTNQSLQKVYVFVGSEGGFSEAEVELFKKYSLAPITLGTQVLRVETACVALVSVIKYELMK